MERMGKKVGSVQSQFTVLKSSCSLQLKREESRSGQSQFIVKRRRRSWQSQFTVEEIGKSQLAVSVFSWRKKKVAVDKVSIRLMKLVKASFYIVCLNACIPVVFAYFSNLSISKPFKCRTFLVSFYMSQSYHFNLNFTISTIADITFIHCVCPA